jgi:sugar-specific transcriptional regulator TrmB
MEMKAKADEELAKYKKAWEEKNGEIKKNAAETIATIEKKYEEIVQKSAGYGIQAMSELIRGIRSRMSALQSVMDEVRSIMGSGMDPNQRNSPSLVDKIKIGVADITAAYSSLKNNLSGLDLKSALVGVAPLALGAVAANTTSNSSTTINQISITVNGGTADAGEQIYRALLAKGVRFSG